MKSLFQAIPTVTIIVASSLLYGQALAAVKAPEADEHTLLLYHFEGDSESQVMDASSAELHGALSQGTLQRTDGIVGKCVHLSDGQTIRPQGATESLRGMDELTVECWFRCTEQGLEHRQRIVCYWNHYIISIFEGRRLKGHVYDTDGTKYILNGGGQIQAGVWYHAALTSDGERARLYLDGEQVSSRRMSGPVNDSSQETLTISNSGGDAFEGDIDELRISNVARTDFIGPRQRSFCELKPAMALSPGRLRVLFDPIVPAGVSSVTCSAALEGGAAASATLTGDALQPLQNTDYLTGETQVLLLVPDGIDNCRRKLDCEVTFTHQGQPRQLSRRYEVKIEPRLPAPEKEFRAAWTHSHRIEDPQDIFSRMAAGGINAAIMRVRRGETAYYNSDYGPVSVVPFDNENLMEDCIAAAHQNGIEMHPYVNNCKIGQPDSEYARGLLEQGRWQKGPHGEDVPWLCPSSPENVELMKQAMLELVEDYDVDGVQYDFIRYSGQSGCYCEKCHRRFEEHTGIEVENWPEAVRADGALRDEFLDARADFITAIVRETTAAIHEADPDVLVTAAVFAQPPEEAKAGVGQDWLRWAKEGYVDALCPMSYVYDTTAFEGTVSMILERVDGAVPVYPGIGLRASRSRMHYPEEVEVKLNIIRRLGAPGFAMFCVTPKTEAPENILIPLRDTALKGDGKGE